MKKKKKKLIDFYKLLRKELTDEEIADAYILPSEPITEEESKEFSEFIKKQKKQNRLSSHIQDLGYAPQSFNKRYSFTFDTIDILSVDDRMRDVLIEDLLFKFRIALQSSLYHGGIWGRGSGQEMKESLDDITKKKELKDLSFDDFDLLKKTGMLWEFYPEAPNSWNDIKR